MENQTNSIILFGPSGSGKSTLANVLTGTNAFKNENDDFSETTETIGNPGMFDDQSVFVIDTPGTGNCDCREPIYLDETIRYIEQCSSIKAFVLVLNYMNNKVDFHVKKYIEVFKHMYSSEKLIHRFAVVWTHYFDILPQQMKDLYPMKKEFINEYIKSMMESELSENDLDAIPHYFVDSKKAKIDDYHSLEELKRFVSWISQLQPIN